MLTPIRGRASWKGSAVDVRATLAALDDLRHQAAQHRRRLERGSAGPDADVVAGEIGLVGDGVPILDRDVVEAGHAAGRAELKLRDALHQSQALPLAIRLRHRLVVVIRVAHPLELVTLGIGRTHDQCTPARFGPGVDAAVHVADHGQRVALGLFVEQRVAHLMHLAP